MITQGHEQMIRFIIYGAVGFMLFLLVYLLIIITSSDLNSKEKA